MPEFNTYTITIDFGGPFWAWPGVFRTGEGYLCFCWMYFAVMFSTIPADD